MAFHGRTLELFGPAGLALDLERGSAVVRAAATAGITLPPAVAEWYCVPELSDLWACYCGQPFLENSAILRDEGHSDLWDVPKLCADQRGWLAEPVLPLMSEIYSSWWWGVLLDGAADPRVAITEDMGETWDVCGASFSEWVFSIFFDAAVNGRDGFGRSIQIEPQVYREQRQRIRDEFRREPTTRETIGERFAFTERYSSNAQRFQFANGEYENKRHSWWRLWAPSREGFDELVVRLSQIFPEFGGLVPAQGRALSVPAGFTAGDVDTSGQADEDIPF